MNTSHVNTKTNEILCGHERDPRASNRSSLYLDLIYIFVKKKEHYLLMENKLVRCYKLSKWNIITICFYILLSFFLWSYCSVNETNTRKILFYYGFGTQFFIYGFQYRALRNFNYFLIWILIAIIHFCVYLAIKDSSELAFVNGNAALGLRSTIITLLLFQFLRVMSLKIQNKELAVPSRNGKTDLLDERQTTIVDVICFIIFLFSTGFCLVTG